MKFSKISRNFIALPMKLLLDYFVIKSSDFLDFHSEIRKVLPVISNKMCPHIKFLFSEFLVSVLEKLISTVFINYRIFDQVLLQKSQTWFTL